VGQAIRLFTVSTVNAAQSGQAAAENLPPEVWADVEAIEGLLKRRIPIGALISPIFTKLEILLLFHFF
jgi:hypothetical protein